MNRSFEEITSKGVVTGLYDPMTGNVFAGDREPESDTPPAVLIVGSPDDATGQLKVVQSAGNYLRVCRWDRIPAGNVLNPDATLQTLPQCGCGGYLGTPQLFVTFREMSEFFFRAFYLHENAGDSLQCSLERSDDDPRDN